MFNFKNFPELKNNHAVWKKKYDNAYKSEFKYDKTGKEEDYKNYMLAGDELTNYNELYAQVIFNVLKTQKPLLHNYIDEKYEQWDDVVKKYKGMPLDWVIPLIEENGGRYRLPKEYYK